MASMLMLKIDQNYDSCFFRLDCRLQSSADPARRSSGTAGNSCRSIAEKAQVQPCASGEFALQSAKKNANKKRLSKASSC